MAEYVYYRVLTCLGQACCNLGLSQCGGDCGGTSKTASRLSYLVFLAVLAIAGLILLFYSGEIMKPLTTLGLSNLYPVDCGEGTQQSVCLGVFTIYRLSFSLAVFHFLMILVNLAGPSLADTVEAGFWALKILVFALILVVSFFIDNSVFVYFTQTWYRDAALYASIAFLLFQSAYLIDFAYEWSEKWVGYYESSEDSSFWCCWLWTSTLSIWGLLIFLSIFNILTASDCATSPLSTILSLLGVLLISLLSTIAYFENGCKCHSALLSSAFISLYCVYLQWSALRSQPERCLVWSPQGFLVINVALGLGFLIIVGARLAVKTADEEADTKEEGNESRPKSMLPSDVQIRNGVKYHSFLVLACMYLSMLLTLWGTVQVAGQQVLYTAFGGWVALITEWATFAMFLWSLWAPKCYPDREFA